jgi:signal transduction histidine kinase
MSLKSQLYQRLRARPPRLRTLLVVINLSLLSLPLISTIIVALYQPAWMVRALKELLFQGWPAVLTAMLISLLALYLLTWLCLRLLLRPLAGLRRSAQGVAMGAAFQPPQHRGLAEFADLGEAVGQMAKTLHARADYIRDFANHVSHEFKTPLTSILAGVELLRDHPEDSQVLDLIDREAQRLHRLTQRLLELARADTAMRGGECEAVSVLKTLALRYDALVFQPTLPRLSVPLPAEVLDSVVSTLTDNAREHGQPSRVQWRLSAGGLDIEDNGKGISPANAERLFTPFFTTNRAGGHTGLGLAIARALLRAHGGDVLLVSSQPACFRVSWPES